MLRPPILLYYEGVTLLESYTNRYKLHVQPPSQMTYGQRTKRTRKKIGHLTPKVVTLTKKINQDYGTYPLGLYLP